MLKLIRSIIKRHIISIFFVFMSIISIIKHQYKENIFVSSIIVITFIIVIHFHEFGYYVLKNHDDTQEIKSTAMNAKGLSHINAFFKCILMPFRYYKEFILKY